MTAGVAADIMSANGGVESLMTSAIVLFYHLKKSNYKKISPSGFDYLKKIQVETDMWSCRCWIFGGKYNQIFLFKKI